MITAGHGAAVYLIRNDFMRDPEVGHGLKRRYENASTINTPKENLSVDLRPEVATLTCLATRFSTKSSGGFRFALTIMRDYRMPGLYKITKSWSQASQAAFGINLEQMNDTPYIDFFNKIKALRATVTVESYCCLYHEWKRESWKENESDCYGNMCLFATLNMPLVLD